MENKRRLAIAAGFIILALFGTWSIFCYRVILNPAIDQPASTDATLILASAGGTTEVGRGDFSAFPGGTLVVSMPDELKSIPAYRDLCVSGRHGDREVICVNPQPVTTQGEARALGLLADEHHWHSVTVVTHRTHVSRARVLMQRCFAGDVRFQISDVESPRALAISVFYESGAFVKASLQQGC